MVLRSSSKSVFFNCACISWYACCIIIHRFIRTQDLKPVRKAAVSENVLSDMCAQRKFRSDSAFAQSDWNIHWMHFGWPRIQRFFMGTTNILITAEVDLSLPWARAHVRRYVSDFAAHQITKESTHEKKGHSAMLEQSGPTFTVLKIEPRDAVRIRRLIRFFDVRRYLK